MNQEYFTINKLSNYSHIGINTLYKAVQDRELAHVVIGTTKFVVSKSDFEKWFDSKKKTPVLHHGQPIKAKAKPVFKLDEKQNQQPQL